MKTELLAEKTALVMQNKNGGFRDLYGSLSTVQWVTFSGSPTENRPVSGHAVYYYRLGPGWCSGELLQTGLAVTSFTSPRHILHTQVETWAEIDINSNIYCKIILKEGHCGQIQAMIMAASINLGHNM